MLAGLTLSCIRLKKFSWAILTGHFFLQNLPLFFLDGEFSVASV